MVNTFYSEFDTEILHPSGSRRRQERTPFQQDRDRIIYSSSFRRLQAKTQVFFSGEYDFYRTRLTHSIEVAQIGRSICHYLQKENPHLSGEFYIDSDLVEAVCLTHDIGHPPFGHAGEGALNILMNHYGGFEGNAQTLRIIAETIYSTASGREGMNPTRAFMDGVMKYKALYSDSFRNNRQPENHFIYDDQKKYIDFIFGGMAVPDELRDGERLNQFRSIECQIMNWADDTAFSLNDIIDGLASGLITADKIEKWAKKQNLSTRNAETIEKLLQVVHDKKINKVFGSKIGDFIRACTLRPVQNFMSSATNRYALELVIDPDALAEAKLYADLSCDLVFRSPQIYQLEFKADHILRNMFAAFENHYLKNADPRMVLMPADTEEMVQRETDINKKARMVCDYISGMTDVFAIRTYKRLFDPDFGSIGDLI